MKQYVFVEIPKILLCVQDVKGCCTVPKIVKFLTGKSFTKKNANCSKCNKNNLFKSQKRLNTNSEKQLIRRPMIKSRKRDEKLRFKIGQ